MLRTQHGEFRFKVGLRKALITSGSMRKTAVGIAARCPAELRRDGIHTLCTNDLYSGRRRIADFLNQNVHQVFIGHE